MTKDAATEARIARLEQLWATRMAACAFDARRKARREGRELDHQRDEMIDAVEKMLFDSLEWENVEAVDISDIAHEAVDAVIAGR
jgi:hypothetical protein